MLMGKSDKKESFKENSKTVYDDLFKDKLQSPLEELGELINKNPERNVGALFFCGELRDESGKKVLASTGYVIGRGLAIYSCLLSACASNPVFEDILRTVIKERDLRNATIKESFNEN